MKRKLVKQGSSTMMISLPSKWIKANKLDKGSEVEIEEAQDKLIIALESSNRKSETSITLVNLTESSIRTLITNTYRLGFDRITAKFSSEQQFKILQKTIQSRLIGFDIIKKLEKECIVESVSEPSPDQFENILGKMFMNVSELLETTQKELENSKEELENFEEIEERIQKYDNFCRRVITKEKMMRNSEMFWNFLSIILHAQREIYHLNKIIDKKTKTQKLTIELIEKTKEIFNMITKAYKTKNPEILAEIHEIEKEIIYKKGYSALEKSEGKEAIIIYHLLASIRNFYLANSPLYGILIS